MPAYINWRRSRGRRAPEQRDELTSFQPIELHPLPLAKVAASGLASFRSWLAATQYFNPHERRFGSFATDAAGLSYQLMSASLRKRPKCCVAAK
jgi:hypothetical protein